MANANKKRHQRTSTNISTLLKSTIQPKTVRLGCF